MSRPAIAINSDVEMDAPRGRLRVHLLASYIDAVAAAGGLPVIVSPTLSPELLREHVARCDGMLFIGGMDYPPAWYGETPQAATSEMHPMRAAADRELACAALARADLPVLAVCGGHQLINLACGGRLIQDLPQAGAHGGGKRHDVTIRDGRILRALYGEGRLEVNSWHHQAVPPDGIGKGLVVTACADDGAIEALEGTDPGRFLLGVQWHPERNRELPHLQLIFDAFIQAARSKIPPAACASGGASGGG